MRLRLTVQHATDVEQDFATREPTVHIGRDPQSQLPLSDSGGMISWHHARIELSNTGARIEDLGSTNGTYLNGRRLVKGQAQAFHENDVIQFGQKGPRLLVRELEVVAQVQPVAATVLTPLPLPADVVPAASHSSRNGSPALAAVAKTTPAPSGPSPTRLMLMQTQRRFRLFTFLAASFAAFALLALGMVAFVLLWHEKRLDTIDEQIAKIRDELSDCETHIDDLRGKDGTIVANTEHMYQRAAGVATSAGPARPEDVYLRTATSTAWIISSNGSGSGALIDRDRRLVVTAYHVVHGVNEVDVVFPKFYNGRILSNVQQYSSDGGTVGGREAIRAKVWATDPDLDLAIVELPAGKLPGEILPLPLAANSVPTAATVHSVGGHPQGSTGLWVYSHGYVREVARDKLSFPNDQVVNAWIVSTQNPINQGNSGGPLVNDRCELVGIASSGGLSSANVVTKFIDVRHVREVKAAQPHKFVGQPKTRPGITIPPPPPSPPPPVVGPSRGQVHALLLLETADPKIGQWEIGNGKQMRGLLEAGLPKDRYSITTLEGDQLTAEAIEGYYRSLTAKVRPEDTVYCYYGGHGCMTGNHHFFYLVSGSKKPQYLQRDILRGWMASGNPRLRVVISDCCSSYGGGAPNVQFATPPPNVLTPLFLRQHGVVDWTAASPGQYGWTGIFTPCLEEGIVAGKPRTWDVLFEDVKKRTEKKYAAALAAAPPGSELAKFKQKSQTPYVFMPPTAVKPD
jgi:S1-C subfamily serine protease